MSNGQQHLQRDFWPQFLNHPRFLRWRCSSSKTEARNFLGIDFLPLIAVLEPATLSHGPGLPVSEDGRSAVPSSFNRETFRPFRQVNPLPYLKQCMRLNPKPPACFTVVQAFRPHDFDYLYFEFRTVSSIWRKRQSWGRIKKLKRI